MRETCVFYASWFEAIETMPEAAQSEAYRAVLSYALRGVETAKQGAMTKLIMTMVKPVIDTNNKRFENGCKGGEFGKLGGRPRKIENPKETPKKPQENPKETPKVVCGVSVNDNVNDNVFSLSFEERERIFEIFYFERNLATAKEECEKFINHYEANGWCRGNSDKPVKSKVALARSWKVEREEKRLPEDVCKWLHEIYCRAKDDGADAGLMFNIEAAKELADKGAVQVFCTRDIYQLMEKYMVATPRGLGLQYGLKKE